MEEAYSDTDSDIDASDYDSEYDNTEHDFEYENYVESLYYELMNFLRCEKYFYLNGKNSKRNFFRLMGL